MTDSDYDDGQEREYDGEPAVDLLERWATPPEEGRLPRPEELVGLLRRWHEETVYNSYRDNYGTDDPHPAPWIATDPDEQVRPVEALAAARVLVDWLTGHYPHLVGDARDDGTPWSDIGTALGVSKQAAWEAYRDVTGFRAALRATETEEAR